MATSIPHHNFMGVRKIAAALSAALLIASVVSLFVKQLALGLDFTGGTQIEVAYGVAPDLAVVREQLTVSGFDNATVQYFGSQQEVLVRLSDEFSSTLGDQVLAALRAQDSTVELRRSEYIGGQVGEELREQGGLAMLLALGVVMLYVAFRFQFKFSVGAVAALIHDVVIVLGVFSLFGLTFDLKVLAAVLAVIGYSLNDTIVVSDRIRENFRILRRATPMEVINISLTQTLSRTLITSFTTLLVLGALLILAGEDIRNFAIGLTLGVFVGTYSSIYVASNTLLALNISKEDLLPPPEEETEGQDERP